jgi:hypothetical protein
MSTEDTTLEEAINKPGFKDLDCRVEQTDLGRGVTIRNEKLGIRSSRILAAERKGET